MKFDRQCFLILRTNPVSGKRSVSVVSDFAQCLTGWDATTRVSPIFTVEGFSRKASPTSSSFPRLCWLVFLGPVHPQAIADAFAAKKDTHLWLSLGLFNVILQVPTLADARKISDWAKGNKICFERWEVSNGDVKRTTSWRKQFVEEQLPKRIEKLAARSLPPELREAILEYCPLALSTIKRASQFPPAFISDLTLIQEHVERTLERLQATDGEPTTYQVLGQIITINAALARFSSQTFAGTSPICQTECHFWSNSLLGIGTATLGLWKLNRFLEHKLGSARLASRVASFQSFPPNNPTLSKLSVTDPTWTTDHLKGKTLPATNTSGSPLIPLLTYFSGREGFNSTESTISAPLASVSACNSHRWSLLTLTHEISHILVNVMAVQIYPRLRSDDELRAALKLLKTGNPQNLLEELRLFLLTTVIGIDVVHSGHSKVVIDKERLVTVIEHWQREVEEIFVHTFDFLWFYGRESEKYIRGIWMSWATIPNIKNRIKDYVVRTICAVLSRYLLQGGDSENIAKDVVLAALKVLQSDGMGGDHVSAAILYIENHWDDEIKERVVARKDLVKMTQAFFFSESLATETRKEEAIVGGTEKEKEGYPLVANEIELGRITNPLRFLELYTGHKLPSATDSAWFFYVLAFCVDTP